MLQQKPLDLKKFIAELNPGMAAQEFFVIGDPTKPSIIFRCKDRGYAEALLHKANLIASIGKSVAVVNEIGFYKFELDTVSFDNLAKIIKSEKIQTGKKQTNKYNDEPFTIEEALADLTGKSSVIGGANVLKVFFGIPPRDLYEATADVGAILPTLKGAPAPASPAVTPSPTIGAAGGAPAAGAAASAPNPAILDQLTPINTAAHSVLTVALARVTGVTVPAIPALTANPLEDLQRINAWFPTIDLNQIKTPEFAQNFLAVLQNIHDIYVPLFSDMDLLNAAGEVAIALKALIGTIEDNHEKIRLEFCEYVDALIPADPVEAERKWRLVEEERRLAAEREGKLRIAYQAITNQNANVYRGMDELIPAPHGVKRANRSPAPDEKLLIINELKAIGQILENEIIVGNSTSLVDARKIVEICNNAPEYLRLANEHAFLKSDVELGDAMRSLADIMDRKKAEVESKFPELRPAPPPPAAPAVKPTPMPTPAATTPTPVANADMTAFVVNINSLNAELTKAGIVKAELTVDFTKPEEALTKINEALAKLAAGTNAVIADPKLAKQVDAEEIKKLTAKLKADKAKFATTGCSPIEALGIVPATADPKLIEENAKITTNLNELDTSLDALVKAQDEAAKKKPEEKKSKFVPQIFGSLTATAFKPDLKIQLQGTKLTKEQLEKIHKGLTVFAENNPTVMEIKYDEKTGLQMQFAKNQGRFPDGMAPEKIMEEKQRAALHMIVTMFANSSNGGTITISGENKQLVAFAIEVAKHINNMLPEERRRKLESPTELDQQAKKKAGESFSKIIQKTEKYDDPKFWNDLVPDITAAERDAVFKSPSPK